MITNIENNIELPLGRRSFWYRFWEILPAILSLLLITLPIILSLINPIYAAVFVLLFVVNYVVRAAAMAGRVLQGHNTMKQAQIINWQERLEEVGDPETSIAHYKQRHHKTRWHEREHYRNLQRIAADNESRPAPSEITNVVIIATYNESKEVLEPTVEAVANNTFPSKQTALVIAYEQRGPKGTRKLANDLAKKYNKTFKAAFAVEHPKDLPREVVGKGGNITYAAREAKKWIEKQQINKENVIITTLDADNRPHREYFSYVTYEFVVNDKRHRCSYQPIALFLNNIWDVPAPMRILATGNSFWNMINSLRPHMLRNFASHSQSLISLEETDFWSTRTIVEDGHQFWRSFFAFRGDYQVIPIYVPIYQDAVLAEGYKKTLKAQFIQLRRWAYGVSDVPYVATRIFIKHREVPFWRGLASLWRLVDGHVSWAATPILLAFSAWTPLFISPVAVQSIAAQELPQFISFVMTVALIGLFTNIFLSMKMLPPRPQRYKRRRTFLMVLQWVMMPVVSIVYGSSAAIYSQIRLASGRYLDKFDATEKAVVPHATDSGAIQRGS